MELLQIMVIPLLMIVFGLYLRSGGPKKINSWSGYRTSLSKKNNETWLFAQVHGGKVWVLLGSILLILSIGAALLVEHTSLILIVGVVQMAALLLSPIVTEIALRKKFDENGERRG